MALTGKNFNENFERRIDKVFNDYYDDETLSDFFVRGLRMAIMSRYDYLDGQKRLDELRTLVITGKEIPATSGRLMLQSLPVIAYNGTTGEMTLGYGHNASAGQIISVNLVGDTATFTGDLTVVSVTENTITAAVQSGLGVFETGSVNTPESLLEYLHLNSLKVKYLLQYEEPINAFQVSTTTAFILFDKRVTLRDGEEIFLSGVQGATSLNGRFWVRRIGLKKYQLFLDSELTMPASANHKYISGGDIFISVLSDKAFQDKPDAIDYTARPTVQYPGWKISSGALSAEPSTGIVSFIINYLRQPYVVIDPLNDIIDLELYHPREFWEYVIDYMAQLFDLETKDGKSLNIDNYQLVKNQ